MVGWKQTHVTITLIGTFVVMMRYIVRPKGKHFSTCDTMAIGITWIMIVVAQLDTH